MHWTENENVKTVTLFTFFVLVAAIIYIFYCISQESTCTI